MFLFCLLCFSIPEKEDNDQCITFYELQCFHGPGGTLLSLSNKIHFVYIEILWAEFHTISSNVSGSASLRLSNNQHSVGKVYIKIQYSLSVQYKTFTYTSYVITICQLMIWQSKINLVLNIRFNFLKNINTTMLYTHNLDVSVSFAFPTHVNQAVDNLKKHKGRE